MRDPKGATFSPPGATSAQRRIEDDDGPFEDKVARLRKEQVAEFSESARLAIWDQERRRPSERGLSFALRQHKGCALLASI